jgi:predicted RNase H-like nuclease (RuvC/YqgF family)
VEHATRELIENGKNKMQILYDSTLKAIEADFEEGRDDDSGWRSSSHDSGGEFDKTIWLEVKKVELKIINSLETKLGQCNNQSSRESEGIEKSCKDEIGGLREEIAKLKEECQQQEKEKKVFQDANAMMIASLHTQFKSFSNDVFLLQDDLARLKSLNDF